jgi:hypothetical protein
MVRGQLRMANIRSVDDHPCSLLGAAFERTVAASTVAFRYELQPQPDGRLPRVVPTILAALMKRSAADLPILEGGMAADGLMQFMPLRFMMDFGHYVVLGQGGREWKGQAGRRIESLTSRPQSHGQPTWLIALAGGLVEATEIESRDADGTWVRWFAAVSDLTRAANRIGEDLALPPRRTLADLERLDVRVGVNDQRIRQVTFADRFVALSIEITDFDASPPPTWDRLGDLGAASEPYRLGR